jgi:Helix-turn-helix domain
MNANQMDLDLPGAPEEKSYPGANGVKLPYWEQDGKIIRIALSDKLILPVTNQKGGHIYTNVPGYGRLEFRGKNAKIIFLSHAAALSHALSRSLELSESIAGHGQSIIRDAAEQGELLRAAETRSLEVEAENARKRAELESLLNQTQKPHQWVNTLAVEWALDQELPTGLKAVLVTFAAHSDEHGESWPSVKYIAEKWKMARETVRAAIGSLNSSKFLIDTGRRAGDTHQVKIHRLPAIAIEGVAVTTPNNEQGTKEQLLLMNRKRWVTPYPLLRAMLQHHHLLLLKVIGNIRASQREITSSGRNTLLIVQAKRASAPRTVASTMEYRLRKGFGNGGSAKNRSGAISGNSPTTPTASC